MKNIQSFLENNAPTFEEFMEYSLNEYLRNKSEYETALADLDDTYYILEVNRAKRKILYLNTISDEDLTKLKKESFKFDLGVYKSRLTFVLNNHAIRMEFWKKLHRWKSPDKSYDDFILKLEQELLLSEKEYREENDLLNKVIYLEEELSSLEKFPDTNRDYLLYEANKKLDYILRQPSEEKLRRSVKTKQMKDMVNSLNSYNF